MVLTVMTAAGAPVEKRPVDLTAASRAQLEELTRHWGFFTYYRDTSALAGREMDLIEIERVIVRRMTLLLFISESQNNLANATVATVLDQVITKLGEKWWQYTGRRPDADMIPGQHMTADDDLLSHVCCRLVFCQNPQWRDWFVRQEELLLRARLKSLEPFGKDLLWSVVFRAAAIPAVPMEEALGAGAAPEGFDGWVGQGRAQSRDFFAVPFTLAPKLVRQRRVLVTRGLAIVPATELLEVFVTESIAWTRRGLGRGLTSRQKALADAADGLDTPATALHGMLNAYFQRFIADPADMTKACDEGALTPEAVPQHAARHMPLCMRRIDHHLRTEGHLKHEGRWEYGLFLKAAGLTMEDAVRLFGTLMTVKGHGNVEAFAKSSYAYNVRHMYGLEGKRTNYSALSCVTMINAPPTRDRHDCHGCPFRQLDEAALKTVIETPTSAGGRPPTQADIEDILSDVRASQHQRACRRYFDLSHGSALGDGTLFRSPFAYYKASLDSAKAGIGPDAPGSSPTGRDTGFRRHADDASPAGDTSPMPGVRSAFVPRPSS